MPDPQFSDDEIQQRAYKIYQARCAASGEPNADRQEAIQQLKQERSKKPNRSAFSWLSRSLTRLEQGAIEPTAKWLDKADIFRIIEKISPIIEAIGIIAIPVAIWWFSETSQEAKEQQEKAIRAQTAVQNYLNQLSDILTTGKLEADEGLQTIVRASTLALLDNPDLQPDLDLDEEENWRNDRKGQTIGYLYEAGLLQINSGQKESVISLSNADLSSADLSGANLSDAQSWTKRQLAQAKLCITKLPAGANLDPDQDCKELGISPD